MLGKGRRKPTPVSTYTHRRLWKTPKSCSPKSSGAKERRANSREDADDARDALQADRVRPGLLSWLLHARLAGRDTGESAAMTKPVLVAFLVYGVSLLYYKFRTIELLRKEVKTNEGKQTQG